MPDEKKDIWHQRDKITILLLTEKHSIRTIAKIKNIGTPSTISRELKHTNAVCYQNIQALHPNVKAY